VTGSDGVALRFGVEDLVSRYSQAVNASDSVTWLACFAPDGVFAHRNVGSTEWDLYLAGRQSLETWFDGRPASVRNLTVNTLLKDVGESGAVAVSTWVSYRAVDGELRPLSIGTYEDEIVSGPDGGLVLARRFSYDSVNR
jgi:hypothetical protein